MHVAHELSVEEAARHASHDSATERVMAYNEYAYLYIHVFIYMCVFICTHTYTHSLYTTPAVHAAHELVVEEAARHASHDSLQFDWANCRALGRAS